MFTDCLFTISSCLFALSICSFVHDLFILDSIIFKRSGITLYCIVCAGLRVGVDPIRNEQTKRQEAYNTDVNASFIVELIGCVASKHGSTPGGRQINRVPNFLEARAIIRRGTSARRRRIGVKLVLKSMTQQGCGYWTDCVYPLWSN